jgi:hypothetical protein
MINKFLLLWHTVYHLKFIQIVYQIRYKLKRKETIHLENVSVEVDKIERLNFFEFQNNQRSASSDEKFNFLNLKVDFKDGIDWNYQHHGKLWNYNLQYFNFLTQDDIGDDIKLKWINSFNFWIESGRVQLEPYPVSLRVINLIRFFSGKPLKENKYLHPLKCIFAQLNFLENNLEFHILGNHLLENAFAIYAGGEFFQHERWLKIGKKLLISELTEQTTADGAHFELSPMYHQIILFRVFESVSITKDKDLKIFLIGIAEKMLCWLNKITFRKGSIPLFNDSANNIALSTLELNMIADSLKIKQGNIELSDSGYRKFYSENFEFIFDIKGISPRYQPGHAHADTFSFEFYVHDKPVIVDTGTSTYISGERRSLERGTVTHNTVSLNDRNIAELWSSHRVARRPTVTLFEDSDKYIHASHDGYSNFGIIHHRSFTYESDSKLLIKDWIEASQGSKNGKLIPLTKARFHFHPEVNFHLNGSDVLTDDNVKIIFEGAENIAISDYLYAPEFNKLVKGKCLNVEFRKTLTSYIILNENSLYH